MTNTEQFALALAEQLTTVWYDPKRNQSAAQIPNVGTITFREADSDPAVIVQITQAGRFKGTAESAAELGIDVGVAEGTLLALERSPSERLARGLMRGRWAKVRK